MDLKDSHRHLRFAFDPDHRNLQDGNPFNTCEEQNQCVDFTVLEVATSCPSTLTNTCQFKVCATLRGDAPSNCPEFDLIGRNTLTLTDLCYQGDALPSTCTSLQNFALVSQEWCVIANPGSDLVFTLNEGSANCDPVEAVPFTKTSGQWTCGRNTDASVSQLERRDEFAWV
jgi:hypothetical protein